MRPVFLLIVMTLLASHFPLVAQQSAPDKALRVGVIGLVHTHVHWILGREDRGDIEIAGIVEPNRELAQRYADQHGYSMDIVYETMEEMIAATDPEAVTAFNTIYGHLEVVEYCAPRGIHVMVEKPMAVNLEHARTMVRLAREHGIQLLTNYETSWYPSNATAWNLIHSQQMIGPIRKMVFHHGHPGPIEIGCNEEFLAWLTDPVLNGGGALTDFGCYGANLATWLLQGQTPTSVTCLRQSFKPDLYPHVEDEATILLTYPDVQVIIQASWNWPYNRKDMEVYGQTGFVICDNANELRVMESEAEGPLNMIGVDLPAYADDPFAYLASVVNGTLDVAPYSVSSLDNNLIVMQILEAARLSAERGEVVMWDEVE